MLSTFRCFSSAALLLPFPQLPFQTNWIVNNRGCNICNCLDLDNSHYKTEQIISKLDSLLLTFLAPYLKK